MKKLLALLLCLMLMLCTLPASAAGYSVELDGRKINVDALFADETVYLSVRDLSRCIGKNYDYDTKTRSAFIGGIYLFAEQSSFTNIYFDGKLFTPTDDSGAAIAPRIYKDTVYLPVHSICEMLSLSAAWNSEKAILSLSSVTEGVNDTPIEENKEYVIINKESGKAITTSSEATDVTLTDFIKGDNQKFTFVKTEFDGFYHVRSALTDKNLDVLSHGTTPGVAIITWEAGTGDNQKFFVENVPGGSLIYARSCSLPLDVLNDALIQNSRTDTNTQKWIIAPFDSYKPAEKAKVDTLKVNYTPPEMTEEELIKEAPYKVFSIDKKALTDGEAFTVTDFSDSSAQKWTLEEVSANSYVIINSKTGKALDVSARSLNAGDSIITYTPNRDLNQQWNLEENADGTVMIKSAHSSLYLTITSDGKMVQEAKNADLKQCWSMTGSY